MERFPDLLALIDRYWGFKELRPLQEQAMRAVLGQRDSLVVLPTGGGKSLCYQAPALLDASRITVVVSPLIALMKDQVDALKAAGVSARHIDSSLTDAERVATLDDLRAGAVRLLFVSPERLMMPSFQDFLKQLAVRTFAIDEAHCISHWGHDFRPEYRQLSVLRELFPDARLHGYTATATQRVRDDIVRQLGLCQPEVLVGNFDRPNLVYRVHPRTRMLDQVVETLKRHRDEAGIVYCIRRKEVDDLTNDLRALGFNVMPYHAGLAPEHRKAAQDAFRGEKCDVVIATVAFGMGIDRSNVRFVLHAGMPKSIEHYQQESGRAGRDGLAAECILLHRDGDFFTWKKILERSAAENAVDAEFLPKAIARVEEMAAYCRGARCRHRALVEHFGQSFEPDNCQACDVCFGDIDMEPDSQDIARKILSCVARVRERFGVGHVVAILHGDQSEKITKYGHYQLTTFGLLKDRSVKQIRDWTYQLIGLGVLDQSADEYPILTLNADSWAVMRNDRRVQLRRPTARSRSPKSRTDELSWEGVDRGLCEALRKWRRVTAEDKGWPPFAIFNDDTLRELGRIRPSTRERLRSIRGIGDARIDAFGTAILQIVGDHCAANGLATDLPAVAPSPLLPEIPASARAYFPQFRAGATLEDVARVSGRSIGTVARCLCAFIESERPDRIDAWVPPIVEARVRAAADRVGSASLRTIYLELGEQVSYELIRITLTFVSIRTHAATQPEPQKNTTCDFGHCENG
jgi:ATP-dependent DNA helicase RecQ